MTENDVVGFQSTEISAEFVILEREREKSEWGAKNQILFLPSDLFLQYNTQNISGSF